MSPHVMLQGTTVSASLRESSLSRRQLGAPIKVGPSRRESMLGRRALRRALYCCSSSKCAFLFISRPGQSLPAQHTNPRHSHRRRIIYMWWRIDAMHRGLGSEYSPRCPRGSRKTSPMFRSKRQCWQKYACFTLCRLCRKYCSVH